MNSHQPKPVTPESNNNSSTTRTIDVKHREEEFLRKYAKKRILRRLSFHIHIMAFVFTNLLLLLINFLTSEYWWVLWVTSAWIVGLAYHAFALYGPRSGFAWHLFSFTIVNVYLVFIYYFTTPSGYAWFLWPLGLWAIGVLTHGLVHFMLKPKKGEDPRKSWIDRKIDQELSRISETPEYTEQRCPHCGAIHNGHAQFCAHCGTELL